LAVPLLAAFDLAKENRPSRDHGDGGASVLQCCSRLSMKRHGLMIDKTLLARQKL
jgi:hypothetical protein